MIENKLKIWLSREELVGVVEALASFPITRPEHSHPYLRAYNAFRRATADQFFEPTLENLKAASRALVSHSDRVAPQLRDAIERAASKIASCAPAPSGPRTDGQAREVFINRHPIFESNLNPFAYELLAQRKQTSGSAPGYLVVIRAMLDKFTEQGLHQLVGDKPSFISVSWEAVVRGHCQALPKQRVVLELLDDVDPDETLFQALAKLSKDGYQIALADSLIRKSDYPLASIANIIKLDLADLGRPAIENRLETLKEYKSKFLADHVETHDDLEFARGVGFDYFQGYFFCKPHITGKGIPVNRLAMMRLLARLQDPTVSYEELEQVIGTDVGLAYKLLVFANSAYVGLPGKVESIRRAVSLVGVNRIRSWASLLMLSKIDNKPRELMVTAAIRARMCEALVEGSDQAQQATFFTVGLFSVLDSILDCTMTEALALLPLSDKICDALLYRQGALGEALKCVLAYEQSDWEGVQHGNLTGMQIQNCYLDSVSWTQAHTQGLGV